MRAGVSLLLIFRFHACCYRSNTFHPFSHFVFSLLISYVKTYLLPDQSKSTKKKTSVKKGVDPIFNETIKVVTIITCGDVYQ